MTFLFLLVSLFTKETQAYGPFEPSIECTVTKIFKFQTTFGMQKFPQLYQSIYNNPLTSKLFIGRVEIPNTNPTTLERSSDFERILIKNGNDNIKLELKGRPISRIGTLTINDNLAAEVTCQ